MSHWANKKMYWAWVETQAQEKERREKRIAIPPTPTTKRLEYVTLYSGKPIQMQLCIGVWDDDKYTDLHLDELAFHQSLEK
jgi:hypothetical protein